MTYASAMTSSRTTTRPTAASQSGDDLTRGWVRLTRAGILGGASLFLASAAHLLGGGALPGAGLLALTGVGLALSAVSLTARRRGFGGLLVALAVQQVVLHLLFHASTTASTTGSACATVLMPGHVMAPSSVCASGAAATGASWTMVVAHTLAVVLTGWLLARGERWLWQLVERVRACAPASAGTVRRARPQVSPLPWRPAGPRCWDPAGSRAPPLA